MPHCPAFWFTVLAPATCNAAVVLFGAALSIAGVAFLPAEWPTWLFYSGISLLVYRDTEIRRSPALMMVAFAVIHLHFLVALVNTYIVTLPGSEVDPQTFHALAESVSEGRDIPFTIGWQFFVLMLGGLYRIFGPSFMLGHAVAIGAFMASYLVILRIMNLLELRRERPWVLALYGLTPSALLIGSFVLRESWELMFLVLTVYLGLLFLEQPSIRRFVPILVSGSIMAMFHWLLGAFVAALWMVLLLLAFGGNLSAWCAENGRAVGFAAVGIAVTAATVWLMTDSGRITHNRVEETLAEALERIYRYRVSIDLLGDPKTAYGVRFDPEGFAATVFGLARIYAAYLFSPVASSLDNVGHVYAVVESAGRFIALLSAAATLMYARGIVLKYLLFLITVYFLMTAFWAIGTTNAGQAIRHHVLSNWVLLVAGMPFILAFFSLGRLRSSEAL